MATDVEQLQNGGYTAQKDRNTITAMLLKSAAFTAKAGILQSDGGDFAVTAQGSPNMTLNVSKGQLVIPDAAGGAYVLNADATTVVTIGTAPVSGTRFDLIIARVYDNAAGDSAATTTITLPGTAGTATVQSVTGTIEVVQGTSGGSPSPPSLPNARCVVLKVVTVGTSVTSINNGNLSNTQGSATRIGNTVAQGGILPVASSAVYPAAPYEGQYIDDATLNVLLRYDGASWVPVSGLGEIASTTFNTDLSSSSSTEVVGYSQVVPLINGRKYRVWVNAMLNAGAAANITGLRIRTNTGTVTNTSTILGQPQKIYSGAAGAGGRTTVTFFAEFTASATGSTNIAIGILTLTGSGSGTLVGSSDTPSVISVDCVA